jgi:hypothetical protein
MAASGIAISSGGVTNVKLTRLLSMEEVVGVRQMAAQLRGSYKPPGQ